MLSSWGTVVCPVTSSHSFNPHNSPWREAFIFIYLFSILLTWTIFKVFTVLVTILFLFYVLVRRHIKIFVPPPGIELTPPCTGRGSLNHWTAKEILKRGSYPHLVGEGTEAQKGLSHFSQDPRVGNPTATWSSHFCPSHPDLGQGLGLCSW